jgi:hypothetical protein
MGCTMCPCFWVPVKVSPASFGSPKMRVMRVDWALYRDLVCRAFVEPWIIFFPIG